MINKELQQIFSEKLLLRFIELGFPKNTATKISKLMSQIEIDNNKIISKCSDEFYRDQIITPQKHEIELVVKSCWGENYTFEISKQPKQDSKTQLKKTVHALSQLIPEVNSEKKFTYTEIPIQTKLEPPLGIPPSLKRSLEPELNFSTFVRCQSNLAAYTACESVANSPGNLSNPLFIYGSTGLGKTHLLHSVGNEILKNKKDFNILYVTSNDFVNDVIHKGIKAGKMEEVRKKYNSCDVLLVDDIQFLENKDACQIEFFHTFNELYQRKKQIVITCDKFPKDIPNIEERLKSRFLQGLLVDIEPPGFEDRVALIESKSQLVSLNLDQESCFLIASHAKTNVREIEGLLKDLHIVKEMNMNVLTKELVINVLKRRFPTNSVSLDIDILTIQKAVAAHFQIKMSELMGNIRQKKFVQARHIAMFLAKEMLNLQAVDISESFGKKDHTTALHAIAKVKEMLDKDPELRENIISIKKKIDSN
ncbi:MAG: chromosomal replication initiator protein DnaA [Bdellovibrionota bacterium]